MATLKKILIADDDAAILDSLTAMLTFEGYEVTAVSDGSVLLKMKLYPDLLLLDIWMSGVDGRDICRQLKQQANTHKLPIVLISASMDIERSALQAGADAFLAKPFDMHKLVAKIEQCIG